MFRVDLYFFVSSTERGLLRVASQFFSQHLGYSVIRTYDPMLYGEMSRVNQSDSVLIFPDIHRVRASDLETWKVDTRMQNP